MLQVTRLTAGRLRVVLYAATVCTIASNILALSQRTVSSYCRHTLAVPEEARDISSTARHRHNLNRGPLRAVDDQIRLDRPEP